MRSLVTNPMRDALLKARDWFVRATAPGDADDNYLNDGGWNDVEDILDAINAALAKCAPSQQPSPAYEWQPIETAPKDGSRILAFVDDTMSLYVDVIWFSEAQSYIEYKPHPTIGDAYVKERVTIPGYWNGTTVSPVKPTRWMLLPEPPRALLNKDGAT